MDVASANGKLFEATFRATTPIFMAGADPRHQAELRLASFKGALRYWWRAISRARLQGLEAVHAADVALFGGVDARSPVRLRFAGPRADMLSLEAGACLTIHDEDRSCGDGLVYLGYGLWESTDDGIEGGRRSARPAELRLRRACLPAPLEFTIRLLVREDRVSHDALRSIEDSLKILGLVGGLGSRVRRGFGSLTLLKLATPGGRVWKAPVGSDAVRAELEALELFGGLDDALPAYTAFSPRSRILLVDGDDGESPLQLLDRLGKEMVRYRSWGKRGQVLGQRPEKNFRADHHLMESVTQGRRVNSYPERIAFGLPQPYYFSSRRSGSYVATESERSDRRASPLWIHVHQVDGEAPVGVLTFLPAQFLPEDETINIGRKSRVAFAHSADFYRPVEAFLDRLMSGTDRVEPFARVHEIGGGGGSR